MNGIGTTLANLLGRRLVVDLPLIAHFALRLDAIPGGLRVTAGGSIQESARVVEGLAAVCSHHVVLVAVLASTVVWNRSGSPDFRLSRDLRLAPGRYEIRYAGPGGRSYPLKRIELGDGWIKELTGHD